MRVLVLSANYPDLKGGISLAYVHTRNKYYKEKGTDITVISFSSKDNYVIDDIPVYSLKSYKKNLINTEFDILICHAPNIKDHYIFLKKYESNFKKILFIFHGHEVLNINKVYPKPYDYVKQNSIPKKVGQQIYDEFKLKLWKDYYITLANKSHFMFVSRWMYEEFLKWTKIPEEIIKDRSSITYNCVGKEFEENDYIVEEVKEYDFITIRSNLDGSKYCIDIVNNLAFTNPKYKFLVIGKGSFFYYNKKAPNLTWKNLNLSHEEVIEELNKSKYALMPTRTDAQGLMMCEMSTFGIPVITSNIAVCKEVFEEFENVQMIDNKGNILLEDVINKFDYKKNVIKNDKYFNVNTSEKELKIMYSIMEEIK